MKESYKITYNYNSIYNSVPKTSNNQSWHWFKTLFIVIMISILSAVFFTGSIPQRYNGSVQNEIIKVQIGTKNETIEGNKESFYNSLTPENIQDYVFYLSPDSYNIANFSSVDLIGLYGSVPNNVSILSINGSKTTRYSYYTSGAYNNSPLYVQYSSSRYLLYAKAGSSSLNIYNYGTNSFNTSVLGDNISISFTNYFDFGEAYNNKYGNDMTSFNLLRDFLYYNTYSTYNDIVIETPIYSEYNVKYANYNWDFKIRQLTKFKNIFEPLFNINNELDENEYNLNNAFNYLKTGIELGYIEFIGDDLSSNGANNNNYVDNWKLTLKAVINPYTELYDETSFIAFMSSKYGQLINLNYYYDYNVNDFVRYDINNYYGVVVEETPKQILKYIANFLGYPITIAFNITYDIGVLFNFIFNW